MADSDGTKVAAALIVVFLAVLLTSNAVAGQVGGGADIDVRDSAKPQEELPETSPVCRFHLVASDFDGDRNVRWAILEQPPTGQEQVSEGAVALDGEGDGRTGDLSLPDGHYEVVWDAPDDEAEGEVFWVACNGEAPPPADQAAGAGQPTRFPAGYARAPDSASRLPIHVVAWLSGLALAAAGLASLLTGFSRRRGRHER